MERQRAGILALVGALLVLALSVVGKPTDLAGEAARAPLPTPPQIGECIKGGRLWIEVPVVPCNQPHTLEVTARWLAEDPDRGIAYEYDTCQQRASEYADVDPSITSDNWLTPMNVQAFTVDAPADQRFGDEGWVICTVAPMIDPGSLTGSLRGPFDRQRPRPAAASKCYGEIGIGYQAEVSCLREHGSEIIAEKSVSVITNLTQQDLVAAQGEIAAPTELLDALTEECRGSAAILLGVEDPTYGGELLVTAEQEWFFPTVGPSAESTLNAGCTVRTADHRGLVGTLLGWGAQPIPYAG